LFLFFTPFVEREIGTKNTLYLFIVSAIGGILILFIYASIFDIQTAARGSSGASMFFIGITVTNLLHIKLNSKLKSFSIAFVVLFLYEYLKIIFNINIFSYGNTILVAHLGGFMIGYLTYLLILNLNIYVNILKKFISL